MTAHFSSQETANQARRTYRNLTERLGLLGLNTDIPEDVRTVAENTVAQTRDAYDRSTQAFETSVQTFARCFATAGQRAAAFNRKIVDLAKRNADSTFDLAKSLAAAKNLADMVELQAAYWRKQFGVLAAQAEEIHALSTEVASDRVEPINGHAARDTRDTDEFRKAS